MTAENAREHLGIVVSGSLTGGVDVRLESSSSIEEIVVGRYVTVEGEKRRFFGMITDITLGTTNDQITRNPPDTTDPFITKVLAGTSTFGTLHILPMLTMGGSAAELLEGPQPVKTVPAHFSAVKLASDYDMGLIFGEESEQRLWIGNPLDMETRLCLNLEEFVKRSNGIFGKSGTGKTFLTRILLAGMLQKSKAVNLVFDMQNEYGWQGTNEGGPPVKGLKQLFPSNVAVFTLDEQNSRGRGASVDAVVKIGFGEVEPEDIALLRQTLNLTDQAIETIYQLNRIFGNNWIQKTLSTKFDELPEGLASIHESTFKNLQRGLATIERLPFMQAQGAGNTVNDILAYLDRGINVVLEFGRHRDITTYVLVSNMLSRRIYNHYQKRTEEAMAAGDDNTKPRPLVITIEEAHKFLNPEVANQTIFGTIAREMRKYNVTLLVIDQRPSGIDEEVMSQLGTKITCLLDNERDIDAVLGGVSGKNELKSVLSRLAAKQQALIFGHAVPMPVAFKPRDYSADSYKEFMPGGKVAKKPSQKDIEDLWK